MGSHACQPLLIFPTGCVSVCSVVSDCLRPTDYSLADSSVHGTLQEEYWSGLPCPPLVNLPKPGIEPASLVSPVLVGRFFTTELPGKQTGRWGADCVSEILLGWRADKKRDQVGYSCIHHQFLELAKTHIHQVSDAIQPSHPLSSPSPPAFNLSQHLSQHQGLF